MSFQVMGCPVTHFRPRISFVNELLLPARLFNIQVPPGLSESSVVQPIYVTPQRMIELLKSRGSHHSGGGLGVVHGLTTAEFSLRFPHVTTQWQRVRVGSSTDWMQYRGGDVYFDVSIAVYVLEGDRPASGDRESEQIFSIIVSHELLHVWDEIDLVKTWLPANISGDRMVRDYLADARPMAARAYEHWITDGHLSDWVRDGLWVPEHNRRGGQRDAPQQYAALQRQIDALRVRQINRPHH